MKLNEIKAAPGFEDLIPTMSIDQQDRREANLIMFKFLSDVEDISKSKNISRKKLAELIGTSGSYITQLFRGDKIINLLTIAKMERVLNIEFDIKLKNQLEEEKSEISDDLNIFSTNSTYPHLKLTSSLGDGRSISSLDEFSLKKMPYSSEKYQPFVEQI